MPSPSPLQRVRRLLVFAAAVAAAAALTALHGRSQPLVSPLVRAPSNPGAAARDFDRGHHRGEVAHGEATGGGSNATASAATLRCDGPWAGALDADPCLRGPAAGCSCLAREFTLLLPRPPPSRLPLTTRQLRDQVVFAFVHINKAGGQTLKALLFQAAREGGWSAAGYGTFRGIEVLARSRAGRRELAEPRGFRCGVALGDDVPPPEPDNGDCKLRAVWGGLALGLCDWLDGRPCVQLVGLRDPVERAISEYNYFCVSGAEGRKKWLPEWKARGRCPLSIVEYFRHGLAPASFLVERLTRGCDAGCGVAAAKANLEHPCLRFLVLEHLEEDASALRAVLREGPLAHALEGLVRKGAHRNDSPWKRRTRLQVANASMMATLREMLAPDVDVYRHALQLRSRKWEQGWVSCV